MNLSVNLPGKLVAAAEAQAAKRGMQLADWVEDALAERVSEERDYEIALQRWNTGERGADLENLMLKLGMDDILNS